MKNDRPPAALRELLNELALIRTGAAARGFTEAEIDVIERVWTGRRLAPARPVAPARPEVEYGWRDGCWVAIGDETDTGTDMTREELCMRVSEMNSSKYMTAEWLKDQKGKAVLLTIDTISLEKMRDGEEKWVMYFREMTEGWVLNKTNLTVLAEIYGDETDDWERQKVVLYAEKVPFGKDMVWGIRCRQPKPQAQPQPGGRPVGKPARPVTQEEADMPDDGWEPERE